MGVKGRKFKSSHPDQAMKHPGGPTKSRPTLSSETAGTLL